jgi:hypothetical protein
VISVGVLAIKRHAPNDAAVLLGALRAHRARRRQPGTEQEAVAESRQDRSLRRAIGVDFDALYARGLALSEADMLALAFTRLDAILEEVQS